MFTPNLFDSFDNTDSRTRPPKTEYKSICSLGLGHRPDRVTNALQLEATALLTTRETRSAWSAVNNNTKFGGGVPTPPIVTQSTSAPFVSPTPLTTVRFAPFAPCRLLRPFRSFASANSRPFRPFRSLASVRSVNFRSLTSVRSVNFRSLHSVRSVSFATSVASTISISRYPYLRGICFYTARRRR